MANYTAADIKALREKTGAGMLDVKKALDQADGNQEKAIEIIRIKGLKGLSKREGRTASEGLIATEIIDNPNGKGQIGYLIEINSETDFVAKAQKFIDLGNKIIDAVVKADASDVDSALQAKTEDGTVKDSIDLLAASVGEKLVLRKVEKIEGTHVTKYMHRTAKDLPPAIGVLVATDSPAQSIAKHIAQHIAAYSPTFLHRDSVPAETVESEERIAVETAKNEGKPEKIIPNIVRGRLEGFYKENVLLDQPLAIDPKKSVGKYIDSVKGKLEGYIRARVGQK
jgi:elongation factor Ts